jgi:hypothetical protein
VDFDTILRRLLVCEIGLFALVGMAPFIEEPYLPAELRAFLESPSDSHWIADHPAYHWILAALIILTIVSWVALWRGWRSGRRLYTALWICSLPTYAIGAPWITGALGSVAELLSGINGGMILGLLYFSEIRTRYEGAKGEELAG